jgi:NMD protein affecting ribosome stability and mRNA decay
MLRRMAEFAACPKCGNRVDENPTTHEPDAIPSMQKTITGGRKVEVPVCPHCGCVLGIFAV